MPAYYNEIDPYAAQWLRNLIAAGHIAPGDVDERSIEDIRPSDLAGYTQCHFFAGIGVWSRALRLAGWADDRPVWTGSCPCQPFSAAGKGAGFDDERHLWPAFQWLIEQCRPPVVFGEQVASPDGLKWLDLVQTDLEASGYRTGAADLCAAGVGAPHIRQRLYWVADAERGAAERHGLSLGAEARGGEGSVWSRSQWVRDDAGDGVNTDRMADATKERRQHESSVPGSNGALASEAQCGVGVRGSVNTGRMDNNNNKGLEGHSGGHQAASGHGQGSVRSVAPAGELSNTRPTHGHWRDADWLFCRDGKWRPVEPGTFPLAHGATARVGRLRAYGNAIVPQVAQAFIEAYL